VITEILVSFFIVCASIFMLLAAIGLLKFPDLPIRMHATTKSGVFATCLIMIAVALYFLQTEITARVIAIITFILITAPVAAHAIGRAAYFAGVPLWPGTIKDELSDYYSPEPNSTNSPEPNSINSPEPNSTKSPEPNSINSPELNSTNSPETDSVNSPELDSTNSPETDSTDSPELEPISDSEADTIKNSETNSTR
jgi:multicomponent Na+:H+ antiporter subunit G